MDSRTWLLSKAAAHVNESTFVDMYQVVNFEHVWADCGICTCTWILKEQAKSSWAHSINVQDAVAMVGSVTLQAVAK